MTQAVLVGSAAVVGGLLGLATNAATAQLTPWPGPLRWSKLSHGGPCLR